MLGIVVILFFGGIDTNDIVGFIWENVWQNRIKEERRAHRA